MWWKWLAVTLLLCVTFDEVSAFSNETWCCDSGFCCEDTNLDCCGATSHERCCQEGYQCCVGQCVVPTCECCDDGCYPPGHLCCEDGGACEAGTVCCTAGCCDAGSTCCADWGCCGFGLSCCGLGCCDDSSDPLQLFERTPTKPRSYL